MEGRLGHIVVGSGGGAGELQVNVGYTDGTRSKLLFLQYNPNTGDSKCQVTTGPPPNLTDPAMPTCKLSAMENYPNCEFFRPFCLTARKWDCTKLSGTRVRVMAYLILYLFYDDTRSPSWGKVARSSRSGWVAGAVAAYHKSLVKLRKFVIIEC